MTTLLVTPPFFTAMVKLLEDESPGMGLSILALVASWRVL